MSENSIKCTNCRVFACCTSNIMNGPANCPAKIAQGPLEEAVRLYRSDPEELKMIAASVNTESAGARKWTRVEDTIDFARQMGYKKLGIATCSGLIYEAAMLAKILEINGFEIVTVGCKCGGIPKESFGVADQERGNVMARLGGNPACNPIDQALILNDSGTDFNLLVGLCVGHDTLFIRHSKAPVSVFMSKDRRLFHHPAGALYGVNSIYFRYLLSPVTLR